MNHILHIDKKLVTYGSGQCLYFMHPLLIIHNHNNELNYLTSGSRFNIHRAYMLR